MHPRSDRVVHDHFAAVASICRRSSGVADDRPTLAVTPVMSTPWWSRHVLRPCRPERPLWLPVWHATAARHCALSGGHGVRLRGHHDVGMATASVVHDWRARYPEFPEPVARLKAAHVWAWPDVEAWARKTGRIK
jgi:hypothetical protein